MEKANGDSKSTPPKIPNLLKDKKLLWILGGLGLLLLLNPLAWFDQSTPTAGTGAVNGTQTVGADASTVKTYEQLYADKLKTILNMVQGISDVEVMVTIDSSEEQVIAENTQKNTQNTEEIDKTGGKRDITQVNEQGQIVMVNAHGSDEPVVIKTIKPTVRGVIVVARGAEQIRNQALIKEAVERFLDVPPHRISVLPRK
ncbi:MAG TPA: stage III sporulation protein AG [Bacilli bacterium]|nr:stage III sporulation protein AG [Bacilli bacterium]